jgi:hypothetical protein
MSEPEQLEDISPQLFDRVSRLVEENGVQERHFNDLQSRYRAMASTWLLAAFIGIGFVISEERLALQFDPLLLVSAIGVAGTVGILLLWMIDLMVYHRLLESVFFEGIKLEDKYSWLPQIRHGMLSGPLTKGVANRTVYFYAAIATVLVATTGLVQLTNRWPAFKRAESPSPAGSK